MSRLSRIGTALAAFSASLLVSAEALAASGYWNNSGFSISHEYYPGRHSSYSYYNYAPQYLGFNRFYFGSSRPRRDEKETDLVEPDPISSKDWAKKCASSCADLSVDR